MRITRVLVVHPNRIAAEAVARLLDAEEGMRTVDVVPTESAAINAVNSLGPDVAVVDTETDHRSAVRFITTLAKHDPPVRVVALLAAGDAEDAIRTIRAGARGVVTKDSSARDLAAAVAAVSSGHAWLAPNFWGAVLHELCDSLPAPNEYDGRLARLTDREREVLDGLIAGRGRSTIAQDLSLSVGTVRTHARNILAKLEVHSSLEAVSVARRCNGNSNGNGNGGSNH